MSKKMMKRTAALSAMIAVALSGTVFAASGNLSGEIVDGAISGSGTLTAAVSTDTNAALQLGNSSGTLSETVTIGGYSVLALDGTQSNHGNAFNAYKTTTLTINVGEISTASTANLINTTVFHAQGGNLNITTGDMTLDDVANGFMAQNGGQLTIDAGDIVVEANNGNALQCSYNKEDATMTITADSISLTSTTGAAISSMGGDVTVTVTGDADFEGSNGLNANHGGTVTINAGGDVTVTNNGDYNAVRGANGGAVAINGGNDITIDGAVVAQGVATVTIDSAADMTINGVVQAEAVRPGGSTISLSGDDITITAKAATPSETEGAVRNASIDATGKVTIEADGLCGVGAGPDKTTMAQSVNSIKAKEIEITSTNAFGVYANNHSYHAVGTRVHSYLEAETIDITSKKDGIYASNGAVTEVVGFDTLNVTSEEQGIGSEFGVMTFTGGDMTVTSAEEGIRSKLGGDLVFDVDSLKVDAGLESIKLTGKSIMDVEAQKVQLDGDITLEDNKYGSPELNITFNGDESYLNGNVTTSEGGVTDMTFNGGATWTTEGSADSNVTNLTMDGGIINQESSGEITIDNLSGTGDVVFSDGSGQVNVLAAGSGATLNLMMTGVDADSFSSTDDLNKLANLLDVAEDATSNVTGNIHVDEGLINGAIDMTVDYEDVDKDDLLNGVVKDVRQGTSTTVASASGVAANTAVAWREEDATLSQRLGELRGSKDGQGVWARFVQGEFERGNDFETEYNMFQIGYDKAKDDWHYGLAVNHTEGDTVYAAGSGELSNTSVLAYGTWLGERGHYKDIVAKLGSIDSEYSINAAGQTTKGEYDTYGAAISAEYGMKNAMGSGWFVTPLAKMTYMHIGGDSYTTNNGINVKHDAIDSLVARLGVELGKELGKKGAVYVKASALHDFCGDADTTLRLGGNSALFTDEIGGTWYEVGFGLNYKMSDATNLYADVIKVYGDEIRTPWQWNAGVRYSF